MQAPYKAAIIAALASVGLLSAPAHAKEPKVYTSIFSKVAVSGYDTVSYFTDGKPQKGDKKFSHKWNGVEWHFVSAEHRDLFAASPEKYAPQFGGYCAWAVSQNYTASADPNAWRIVDGKLYLNYSDEVQKKWEVDIPGYIASADKNWPALVGE